MLTVRDYMALDLAGRHWKFGGAYESAVSQHLGMSFPRYCVYVSRLIRRPEAEATHPALVHRLRRLEDARRAQRTA